jgi:hypothetical protein
MLGFVQYRFTEQGLGDALGLQSTHQNCPSSLHEGHPTIWSDFNDYIKITRLRM